MSRVAKKPVDLPQGVTVTIGGDAVTVKGAVGVTINGVSAGTVTISAQYGAVTIYKRASNEWIVPNAVAA